MAAMFLLLALLLFPGVHEAPPQPDSPPLSVATWNLEWFYDEHQGDNYSDLAKSRSAPSRSEWEWKRDEVAKAIAEMRPTILALQEVEGRQQLFYLTQQLKRAHGLNYRIAFIQGNDHFTEQDVAILYREELVSFCRREQTQAMFDSRQYYNLSKHLFARFTLGQGDDAETLTVCTVHLRAREQAADVRRRQARLLRYWLDDVMQHSDHVILLGDLNCEQKSDDASLERTVGILSGRATSNADDDLVDLHQYLAREDRNTHIVRGKQFDRILVSKSLMPQPEGRGLQFRRIRNRSELVIRGSGRDPNHFDDYYAIPADQRDLSDHYPLTAEFTR